MNADEIVREFGNPADAEGVAEIFDGLGTYQRPESPGDGRSFHDWVLIRRKGIELGFVDSEYQAGADRYRWGHGELLFSQAYFYAGFDDVQPFVGELPFGLCFTDSRHAARSKVAAYEETRHSYRSDTWDVDGYRLTVSYNGAGTSIDRIACRVLAAPIQTRRVLRWPNFDELIEAFGFVTRSPEFITLWREPLSESEYRAARDDGEIDLTGSYGATLHFAESNSGPVFRAVTLHRNRDSESVGWLGALPHALDFEDSPEALFGKISLPPVQHADSAVTGHAVWHFDAYTLHVLYSNVDNRLLRIKLIAPGTWKCIEEIDYA
ncbi:hypothetical protein [Trinickia soli]|uniref:Uncharacterized protein n=1 Tax=Trinickia soli TaxID=380675 RepID=A0A2N7VGM2_9BURK|nr:hypothetical protein [Trinickia soli]PMS16293.1 hypothetical protein C0Z19_26160 [Trinickia soli]CAB3727493.1 hypothetical protein LMG24076_05178 [Trinickia soli]